MTLVGLCHECFKSSTFVFLNKNSTPLCGDCILQ
jgi:hypothetical protein